MKTSIKDIVETLVERYLILKRCDSSIEQSIELLVDCFQKGNKLLVCGNGGSASDALHIVGELMKSFKIPRVIPEEERRLILETQVHGEYLVTNLQRALPAIALVSESSLITACINDTSADIIFAQQVYGYGKPGDVLLAISTSGNSKNVVYAAETANALGMSVIALTGESGGELANKADILIDVPERETDRIQELHLPIYHTMCMAVEKELFE